MAVGRELEYGANIALRDRAMITARRFLPGSRIVCLTGRLWVTFDRDREDHLLLAGDRLLTSGRMRGAVVYAIEPSELVLLRPERFSVSSLFARILRRRFALRL